MKCPKCGSYNNRNGGFAGELETWIYCADCGYSFADKEIHQKRLDNVLKHFEKKNSDWEENNDYKIARKHIVKDIYIQYTNVNGKENFHLIQFECLGKDKIMVVISLDTVESLLKDLEVMK